MSQFNFKDGLIYLDDGKGNGVESDTSKLNHDLMYDGHVSESKLLWALGNFSRFVRPGMVRIDVQLDSGITLLEQATDLQVSAYKDITTGRIVMVFLNHTKHTKNISLNGISFKNAALYVTDKTRNLDKSLVELSDISIPKRSVTTLVIDNN